MTDGMDYAFDRFLTSGSAPWIVERVGDGIDALDANLPAASLQMPDLIGFAAAAGARIVSLSHDFVDDPILTITKNRNA